MGAFLIVLLVLWSIAGVLVITNIQPGLLTFRQVCAALIACGPLVWIGSIIVLIVHSLDSAPEDG